MKKPKVQLKKLQMFEGHDGYGFNADIWVNGVKCFHAHDDAWGGEYEYYDYKDHNNENNPNNAKIDANVQLLNDYIASLPEYPLEFNGNVAKNDDGSTKMLKHDLDSFINGLVIEELKAKEEKKLQKKMKTCILFGKKGDDHYAYLNFKKPLSSFPLGYLQMQVDQIKKQHCTGDIEILNTNLGDLGVKL